MCIYIYMYVCMYIYIYMNILEHNYRLISTLFVIITVVIFLTYYHDLIQG